MKIAVLNGSPKGPKSVTMQYVAYLQKKHPEHDFVQLDVAHRVKKLETDEAAFNEVIEQARSADGVLWGYPLYVMLVCSQYKRFIELVFERGVQDAFSGKHAAALSTSIHFFDNTALDYIHAISEDLGMRFCGNHTAAMDDLLKEPEQRRLELFGEDFLEAIAEDRPVARRYAALPTSTFEYRPDAPAQRIDAGGLRVLVVTDALEHQTNLRRMVDRFVDAFEGDVEVVNLHDVDTKGGCLGCCKCAFDNECVYDGKDGFRDLIETKVTAADVLIFAGAVVDRHLSWKWRQFFDRAFYRGHLPLVIGKQCAYIISGPWAHLQTSRQIFQAYAELGPTNLVDFVTDESEDSAQVDALLDSLARRMMTYAKQGYLRPQTFLHIGGSKLFRDEIWGPMRMVFQADYAYYRKMGYFDFPQGDWRTRVRNAFLMPLTRIPSVRKTFRDKLPDVMLTGYPKVVDDA